MAVELLQFPHKIIRAKVIKDYMAGCYEKAVCFSCGNAAEALAGVGVDTLHIGPRGVLQPRKWFTPKEVKQAFPSHFDATSGHLTPDLMHEIGKAYRMALHELPGTVYVPSGSGETLVCLKMVYPDKKFVAVYNLDEATEYSEEAPLNTLVRLLAEDIIFADRGDWRLREIRNPTGLQSGPST